MAKNQFPTPKPAAPKPALEAPAVDDLVEALPEPVAAPDPVPVAPVGDCGDCCHKVQDGDSYASLGKLYAAPGQRGFERALEIQALNGSKPLIPGSCVKVS